MCSDNVQQKLSQVLQILTEPHDELKITNMNHNMEHRIQGTHEVTLTAACSVSEAEIRSRANKYLVHKEPTQGQLRTARSYTFLITGATCITHMDTCQAQLLSSR